MMDSTIFEVDYYFSDKIFKQLNLKETSSIFLVDSKNLVSKISKNQDYDFVIIGTAHRYFNTFLKISTLYKTSIIVHNIDFTQLNLLKLFSNIFKKETIFRLKLLFKEGLFLKNKLYRNTKCLFLLDEDLSNFNKDFQHLPVFYSLKIDDQPSENISIVIPGSVSQDRRDYKKVLKELKTFTINQSSTNYKIEIVFLGKAENEELNWLIEFKTKNFENVKVIYFDEKVSQKEFDFYMKNATFLWCSLQQETNFFSQPEYYGTSKMSGIIGDAIKYRKVVYLPQWYYSRELFVQINLGDISEMIRHFLQLEKINHFAEFEKSEVLKKLENTLENCI